MVRKYEKLNEVWPLISTILDRPSTEGEFDELVALCDYLLDQTQGDENHPLMGLLDIVGTMIEEYERLHVPEPQGDPIGCLKYFMNEYDLMQKDLVELGSPGVVSEILSGKRELNKRQIKALGKRFKCNPAVFI